MKYIEIDEKMDQVLSTLCDLALRTGGLQLFPAVRDVLANVKDKTPSE